MSMQFPLGKWLLRAAVSVGFLGCVFFAETGQAAAIGSSVVASKAVMGAGVVTPGFCGSTCATPNNGSDFVLTVHLEIALPDEFGVALEDDDSLEMLRVEIEQRTFGIDQELIGPRIASTPARNIRPSVSPPLVV
jgi:hypothetical protein